MFRRLCAPEALIGWGSSPKALVLPASGRRAGPACISPVATAGSTSKAMRFAFASVAASALCLGQSMPRRTSECGGGDSSTTRMTVVLLGDSNTGYSIEAGGWGQRLTQYYSYRADVLYRGFPGFNTRFGLLAADRFLRVEGAKDSRERFMNEHLASATLWTVMFGTNDSGLHDGGFKVVHVPVEEYERKLLAIVCRIQSSTRLPATVLLFTPPMVDDLQVGTSHTNKNTGLYAEAARKVAAETNAVLVDLFAAMQAHSNPSELLKDGLHLSEQGNQFAFELLKKTLEERLPQFTASKLPFEIPLVQDLWGDQDYEAVFKKY